MAESSPHLANVPGEFYVEDGCCTLCEVPFREAPDLFERWPSAADPIHCYVKRQPESPDELDRMIEAIRCAELGCIHYRGDDRIIQSRLVEAGEGMVCNHLTPDLRQRVEQMEAARERRLELAERDRRAPEVTSRSWWHRLLWWGRRRT